MLNSLSCCNGVVTLGDLNYVHLEGEVHPSASNSAYNRSPPLNRIYVRDDNSINLKMYDFVRMRT